MKITPYLTLISATATLAIPALAVEAMPNVNADALAFMNELAPMLSPPVGLPVGPQVPQLPSRGACTAACDAGARDLIAFCAIIPATLVRVVCLLAAGVLDVSVSGDVCHNFCTIIP